MHGVRKAVPAGPEVELVSLALSEEEVTASCSCCCCSCCCCGGRGGKGTRDKE